MNPKQEAAAAVLRLTTEFNKAHFLTEQLQWACEMGYLVPERHRAVMLDSLATLQKLRRGQDFAQKLELCRASGMTFGPDEQILARQFRGWQKLFAINSGEDQSNIRYLPHIIAARNKFARAEGSENFYALQVRRNDNLFYWQVFDLLDTLVDKAVTSLRFEYDAEKSVFEILEKHVRLADVFSIWGQTFAGLGTLAIGG